MDLFFLYSLLLWNKKINLEFFSIQKKIENSYQHDEIPKSLMIELEGWNLEWMILVHTLVQKMISDFHGCGSEKPRLRLWSILVVVMTNRDCYCGREGVIFAIIMYWVMIDFLLTILRKLTKKGHFLSQNMRSVLKRMQNKFSDFCDLYLWDMVDFVLNIFSKLGTWNCVLDSWASLASK